MHTHISHYNRNINIYIISYSTNIYSRNKLCIVVFVNGTDVFAPELEEVVHGGVGVVVNGRLVPVCPDLYTH